MFEKDEFVSFLKERNIKVVFHFPHVGLKMPKHFYKGLLIKQNMLSKYIIEMSDYKVDELFKEHRFKKIKSKYSRLYCDVERFRDDDLEEMSKVGQGVVYTNTYDNIIFHEHDYIYKKKVLKYYDIYHNKFNRVCKNILNKGYKLLILDCHSFSEKMASHIKEGPFPDICLGIEEDFYNNEVLNHIKNKITKKGYNYMINYPYKGSIVPNFIYNNKIRYKDKVISIMIEINKKIYLDKKYIEIK